MWSFVIVICDQILTEKRPKVILPSSLDSRNKVCFQESLDRQSTLLYRQLNCAASWCSTMDMTPVTGSATCLMLPPRQNCCIANPALTRPHSPPIQYLQTSNPQQLQILKTITIHLIRYEMWILPTKHFSTYASFTVWGCPLLDNLLSEVVSPPRRFTRKGKKQWEK